MPNNHRDRLIFHAAILLLVGLLCGFPAVAELGDQAFRAWRAAHLGLITIGIWLLVTASVFPSLVLGRREALALVWSLLATEYGFMTAVII